jgi:RHS repeat-associated protein
VHSSQPDGAALVHRGDGAPLGIVDGDASGTFSLDALGNPVANGQDSDTALRTDPMGPYGEASRLPGALALGYQGELRLPSGLVHLRNRNYDPTTGSFTTTDPLDGVAGTTTFGDPYPYAYGDPVNNHDPLGLRGEEKDETCKGLLADIAAVAHLSGACDVGIELLDDVQEFVDRNQETIVSAVVGIGAGAACIAITGATAGLGLVACAALGGALAGGTYGAMTCEEKNLNAACVKRVAGYALVGGIAGAGGAWLTAAAGGGAVATALGSSLGAGIESAGTQLIETGEIDPTRVGVDALIGGGVGFGLHISLSQIRLPRISRGAGGLDVDGPTLRRPGPVVDVDTPAARFDLDGAGPRRPTGPLDGSGSRRRLPEQLRPRDRGADGRRHDRGHRGRRGRRLGVGRRPRER